MATRSRSTRRSQDRSDSSAEASQAIRDSVQKIWLAGLGALERARTDGPRMFETLVEQGRNMGARAVGAADEVLKNMRQANYSGGSLDKLEKAFQERVSKSLTGLGLMNRREVEELAREVRDLNASVRSIMSGTAKRAAQGAKRAARTASGKRTSARKRAASNAGAAKAGAKRKTTRRAKRRS